MTTPTVPMIPLRLEALPPRPVLLTLLELLTDPRLAHFLHHSAIREVQIRPPHRFHLMEEAYRVDPDGIIMLNPNLQRERPALLTLLVQLAATSRWTQLTFEQQETIQHQLRDQDKMGVYQHHPIETLYRELLPAAYHGTLPAPLTTILLTEPYQAPENPAPPRKTLAQIQTDHGGYFTQQDNLSDYIATDGDFMVIMKDSNGGRHHMPASLFLQCTSHPIIEGYIRSVILPAGPIVPASDDAIRLDAHTLNHLPLLKEALTQLFPQKQIKSENIPA